MEFLHGRALDNNGEELIQVGSFSGKFGLRNGRFPLYIGGKFIADYETEEKALEVRKMINEALFNTHGSVAE